MTQEGIPGIPHTQKTISKQNPSICVNYSISLYNLNSCHLGMISLLKKKKTSSVVRLRREVVKSFICPEDHVLTIASLIYIYIHIYGKLYKYGMYIYIIYIRT